jgi:hypothetical protein
MALLLRDAGADIVRLQEMGMAAVFPGGMPCDAIVTTMRALIPYSVIARSFPWGCHEVKSA